jgi:hypothetical protein
VDSLIAKKEELMKFHTGKLQEINAHILELLADSLKDKKTDAVAKIKLLEFFKASGSVTREASINMESREKLELAKGFFENAKMMVDAVKTEPGYSSVLKDIDIELDRYRKEIELIDVELKTIEDEEKRKALLEDKKRHLEKRA